MLTMEVCQLLADLVLVLIVLYSAGKSFLCEISEIRETQKEKKKKTPPPQKKRKKKRLRIYSLGMITNAFASG